MNEPQFRHFFETTRKRLWAYLVKVCGDRHLADDLLQESYIRLLQSRAVDLEDTAMKAYLYRIATNLLHDHWRRTKNETEWNEDAEAQLSNADVTTGTHLDHDLTKALDRLPARQRMLLWLAYVEGYEHREIAAMLELGEKSVRVLLFRARRNLSEILQVMGMAPEVRR